MALFDELKNLPGDVVEEVTTDVEEVALGTGWEEVTDVVQKGWDKVTEAFSKNGVATTFLEKSPGVGYLVSAVHGLAGNSEEAKRAAARSTKSLVTLIATVAGAVAGGPAGGMAGAASGNAVGITLEHAISQCIKDGKVKAEVGDMSALRFIIDTALAGVGGGAGEVGKMLATELGQGAVKRFVTSKALTTLLETLPEHFAHKAAHKAAETSYGIES